MDIGAGGNWKRSDEKFDDSIVKQTTGVSCMSAAGEMLLRKRGIFVSQEEIRDIIGEPSYVKALADCLNSFDKADDGKSWLGISTDEESLETLLGGSDLAIVLLEQPFVMGHAVVVAGRVRGGMIKILDPFDQTSYKMSMNDLLEYWGGEVVTRWQVETE
jgi:ABC-type bacteriocin/lantibiotic exporter with double-glycine peptidase domain